MTRVRAARFAAFLLGGLMLAGAAAAQPKLTAQPDQSRSDAALLHDEARAIAEFQRRVRGEVHYSNGLLVIADQSGSGVSVAPATIYWMVDCGDGGLGVTFGTGSGDTDNGVALQITGTAISAEACQRIAPAVGATVLAIAKGE